jgi:hypothetical protein
LCVAAHATLLAALRPLLAAAPGRRLVNGRLLLLLAAALT